MRISDWSSDVCSSDLLTDELLPQAANNGSAHDSSKTGFRFLIDFPPVHGTRYVCGVRWRPGGRNAFWPHGTGKTNAGARAAWNRHCGEGSEEHTSELQSLLRISYAVSCMKKKRQCRRKIITLSSLRPPRNAKH